MEHHQHASHEDAIGSAREYVKFSMVMVAIVILSWLHASINELSVMQFIASFMGVFFIVFGLFKLIRLKEFAVGFQMYDLLARKSIQYAYIYPFIQLTLGLWYLLGGQSRVLDALVLAVSLISAAGVMRAIKSKQTVHCVCLGSVIKLPISTISFVEDFGMGAMALVMLTLY